MPGRRRRFRLGLVVGKFCPLHRGHEALIQRARSACDSVIILSYCNPELPGCEAMQREKWLAELYPNERRIVATDEYLRQHVGDNAEFGAVPENDAPDTTHRDFCAFLLERFAEPVDAVFTSEDYGEGLADHLTRRWRAKYLHATSVEHVSVDRNRVVIPVSGSTIRAHVHAYRNWLSPVVYGSFVQRICILGGESSGKSMLACKAAEHFGTTFVPEYGRELWMAKAGQLAFDDMLEIAQRQVEREQKAMCEAGRYLFCDTSPLTTLFYSLEMFARADVQLQELALRPYDLHVLCAPDFKFVQDGTRRDAEFRQRQHDWYVQQFDQLRIPYLLVKGSIGARVGQVARRLVEAGI